MVDNSWNLLGLAELGQFCIEYRELGNSCVDPENVPKIIKRKISENRLKLQYIFVYL